MYHYTDVSALYNIMKENELWLTHAGFLNDSTEGGELFTLYKDTIKIDPNILKILNYLENTHETYCLSFSTEKDLLSQWRGYCPQVGGYNLEFDDNILDHSNISINDANNKTAKYPVCFEDFKAIESGTYLKVSISNHNCLYSKEEKIKHAQRTAKQLATTYEALVFKNPQLIAKFCSLSYSKLSEEEKEIFNQMLSGDNVWSFYVNDKYIFKHSAFKEESEIRIFVTGKKEDIKPFYRFKKNLLIPYLKLKFPPSFLKNVIIGPCENQDHVKIGLTHFLSTIERNELISSIDQSEIPYRSL